MLNFRGVITIPLGRSLVIMTLPSAMCWSDAPKLFPHLQGYCQNFRSPKKRKPWEIGPAFLLGIGSWKKNLGSPLRFRCFFFEDTTHFRLYPTLSTWVLKSHVWTHSLVFYVVSRRVFDLHIANWTTIWVGWYKQKLILVPFSAHFGRWFLTDRRPRNFKGAEK